MKNMAGFRGFWRLCKPLACAKVTVGTFFLSVSAWLIWKAYCGAAYESNQCQGGALASASSSDKEGYGQERDTEAETCSKLDKLYKYAEGKNDQIQKKIYNILSTADNPSLYADCSVKDLDSCRAPCSQQSAEE
jgi:hypothetical protein